MNLFNLLALVVCVLSAIPGPAGAQLTVDQPITFKSDELDARRKEGLLILKGHVVVEHDKTTLKADAMTIFYGDDQKTIERIEADGKVRMTEPGRRGRAKHAIYWPATQKLNMTGSPSIWDEGNQLTGTEITIFRNPDRLSVKQARAIVQPDAVDGVLKSEPDKKQEP